MLFYYIYYYPFFHILKCNFLKDVFFVLIIYNEALIFKIMISNLSETKKALYSSIIFNNHQAEALLNFRGITESEDIAVLKHIYDQKIAFQAAYIPIKPPKQGNQQNQQEANFNPSLIATLFFCLFPQQNRELFDITNQIFLKRFFAVLLFWKKNFLSVGGGSADLYGPVWITVTYIILIGFMGNFTVYMVDSLGFDFMESVYANILGTVTIFLIAEILFYPTVLSCLGGFMMTKDAVCIIGYSLVLYFIPTILCMFTSLAWYVTCLFSAGIIRSIFLYRNFSTRIESRTYILLIVFLIVEFFYAYVLLQIVFFKYSGYTFDEGINQLTASATALTPNNRLVPPSTLTAPSHMLSLRHFLF